MIRATATLIMALLTIGVHGQNTPGYEYRIDWAKREAIVTATIALGSNGSLLPGERLKAEREITRQLPLYVQDALFSIAVDSFWSVEAMAIEDPEIMSAIEAVWETGTKIKSYLNANLTELTAEYRFSLYPHVIAPFVRHTSGFPPERRIGHYPSEKFTGLVIYAKGEYPIHGKRGNETTDPVRPALLPTLYDQQMNVIFDSTCMDPGTLLDRGMVLYTDSEHWQDFEERVGPYPLLTMAREVFGENRTDIVLPDEAARRILALDHNIRQVCSGNILIIVDL